MTTPADMGRFIAAHLATDAVDDALGARRILSPAATALMHAPHWRAQLSAPGAAYGFFEGSLNGHRTLFHTGDSGDHSLVLLLPDERVGLYFVFSGSDEQTDARDMFARGFMNTFFPKLAPTSRATDTASREGPAISTLAGVYRSAAYSRSNYEKVRALFAQVTVGAGPRGTLLVTPPGSSASVELERTGALTFCRDSGEVVAFRTAPDGRVIGFTLSGLIWDPSSWDRIPWWENGRLHIAALGVATLILLARLAWTPVAWIVHRARGRPMTQPDASTRRAWRWSGLVALGFFVAPLTGAATALVSFSHPLRAIPRGIAVATTLLLIDVVAGVALGLVSAGSSRNVAAPRAKRVMIALTAVAFATLAIVLIHWNLLAPWSLG